MFENIEFQPVEEIKKLQEQKLKEALIYLKDHSPFYQRLFKKYNIHIEKIKTIEDLQHIPFTDKKDLQLYNEDFVCAKGKNY